MKNQFLLALPLLGAVVAHPHHMKRAVPREHAHEDILRKVDVLLGLNNPDNIQAAVFGLLGAKAAAAGAGDIADPDCLHQATADQAFTNAKAAGDVDGQTDALIFRALERNTGSVGLKSVPCVSIKAVNPEIAALQQHQDAAADGAQALNKEIAAELARQIASIGGDPLRANEASTFAPGQIGDPTANGGGCDDANDAAGCINTLGLRVDDLSEAEITAAVAGAGVGAGAGAGVAAGNNQTAVGNNQTAVAAPACNANLAVDPKQAAKDAKKAQKAAAKAAKQAQKTANQATKQAQKTADKEAKNAQKVADQEAAQNTADAGAVSNNDAQQVSNNDVQQTAGFAGCNAAIVFGPPSDGRQQDAFEAEDLETFNHGSALNIKVISGFICSQLSNKCDVDEAAVAECEAAAAAADGLTGQAAADAFNSAIGF